MMSLTEIGNICEGQALGKYWDIGHLCFEKYCVTPSVHCSVLSKSPYQPCKGCSKMNLAHK